MHWNWNYPWEPLPTWLMVAVGAALIFGSYALVRRELKSFSPTTVAILLARLAGLAILVFVLLQPSVFLTRTEKRPPVLPVLIDTSESMNVVDKGEDEPRIHKALRLLNLTQLTTKLGKKSRLRVFTFTTGLFETPTERLKKGLIARGKGTSLGLALSQLRDEFRADNVAGVVILSDGRNNIGSDPILAARKLEVPIFAVGFGKERPPEERAKDRDLAIVSVAHDRRVLLGHSTDITVTVSAKGFGAQSVPVELALDDKVITRSQAALSPDRPERQITLKLNPLEPGQFVYTVRVPADQSERNKGNNEKAVPIYVTDPISRVLYVEERPRSEFKFLSRVLSAYKNIRHTSIVRTSPEKTIVQGSDPAEAAMIATMGPAQLQRLKAIIIGDVQSSFFNAEQLETLAAFVEQGGSIALLAGRSSLGENGLRKSVLAKALPFRSTDQASYVEREFGVELTPEGRAHPAFQNVEYQWAAAPNIISMIKAGPVLPGATVLMRTTDDEKLPVVVAQRYGHGKIAVILSDTIWRWKLGMASGSVADDLHTVFWRQLIAWLMPEEKQQKETRAVQLIADKVHYELGETVRFTISALEAEGRIAREAKVTCRIFTPDGKDLSKTAILETISSAGDTKTEAFVTDFTAHVSGKYKVVASATSKGITLGRDELSFAVGDTSVELENIDPDHELLQKLAAETKGDYYTEKGFSQLVTDIPLRPKKHTWTEKRQIWNEWWVFLCFIGLVSAEWAMRKWRQLE